MDIYNKVIAITGGAGGLGLEMAMHLSQKGANIALIDVNQTGLNRALGYCAAINRDFGTKTRIYNANVANEEEVIKVFTKIRSDFGSLHGLINNAGITRDALMVKTNSECISTRMSYEQWKSVIDVNLTGTFLCGREAATLMIESESKGVIVNIASISKAGNMGQSNYSASKAGVEALCVTWAKELSRHGIRSAAVAPGFIETDLVANMKPELQESITERIPLKEMGRPLHISKTVSFILENDYISGRTIEVDAGLRF
ncbi:SDR family oxidoreductase [Pseudomaricurvus alkylphenolicus]|uniref:SDR family oxidoreductase n=1 Tax=Pseudomaricurvus alkylphenolicus TaxID=1306991 RepID=UPI00141EDD9C|nr:SDR family oxidoreductase [Pseudomaricurvus alkylphenolicus]NIB42249.1 SDR family oxidoreductase [Pseudomaricurvus alkylphenolicus]